MTAASVVSTTNSRSVLAMPEFEPQCSAKRRERAQEPNRAIALARWRR
jgi:hypothetical protein